MRTPRFILALALLASACGGKSKKVDSARDAASPSQAEQSPLAELAGSWSGSAYINGYGSVAATATLDATGQGHYFVTLAGNSRTGLFRILSWDRSYLLVEAEGHRERIHATHKGDSLWVDNALIGQVRLQRGAAN